MNTSRHVTLAQMQDQFRSWLLDTSDADVCHLTSDLRSGPMVYRHNYRAQLVDCLEMSFPNVRKWLGDEVFRQAAVAHVDSHPPHAWTLDAYGDEFGETLAAAFPDNPDLHELVWIEHALSKAFVARDSPPVSIEELLVIDWSSAYVRLAPSFRSRVATTNAEAIWSALCADQTPPESEMLSEARALVVWRRDFTTRLWEVDVLEHDALLHVERNGSFASLYERVVEQVGDTEGIERTGVMLARWLRSGLIAGIATSPQVDTEQTA